MAFLIIFLLGTSLAYSLCRMFFRVLSFPWLLRVKQFQELLDEGRGDVHLQSLDIGSIIDDQLQEEFVNWLQVRPCRVDQKFLLRFTKRLTSSMPTPSPGKPAFFKMGSGLKMFFSIMLMTRSRWGMMTVDMQVGSANKSLNSCK
jgi:hypothetical protein